MKRTSWSALKQLIGDDPRQSNRFLTVIDEKGSIRCANIAMIRDMELNDPRMVPTNFFDLVHPAHLYDLQNALAQASETDQPGIELHIKNGHYHPMKWKTK